MLTNRLFTSTKPRSLLAAILATAMLGTAAHAATYTIGTYAGSGTDTNPSSGGPGGTFGDVTASGQVVFTYDSTNKQLDIALSNTTTFANFVSRDEVLTTVAFHLGGGFTMTTGGTAGATGTLATYSTSPSPDGTFAPAGSSGSESSEWGGGALTGSPGLGTLYPTDNEAATCCPVDITPTFKAFDGTNLHTNNLYGVIPTITHPTDADNFNGTPTYTWGTINLVFNLGGTGVLTDAQVVADLQSDITSVNLLFGASEPPTVVAATAVPAPAAFVSGLALLAGLAGFGLLRKRMIQA